MSRFGFLTSFFATAAKDTSDSLLDEIINHFPATANRAQIDLYEKALNEARQKMGEANTRFEKENREFLAVKALRDQRLEAARKLREQRDTAATDAEREVLNTHLTNLVDSIKGMEEDFNREKSEAEQAERILTLRKGNYEKAYAKIMAAKRALESGAREVEAAALELELAKEEASAARAAAGLASQADVIDVVGKANNAKAEKARSEAAALRMEASMISNNTSVSKDNGVDAALAAAAGKPAKRSVDDELDSLLG